MNAESLTKALKGRWSGSGGIAKCPSHPDKTPSLSIRDGDGGKLLTCCHAGCPPEAVWAALRDRGLVEDGRRGRTSRRRKVSDHQPLALDIWRASRDPMGKLTAAYLRHRTITVAPPASIRDHPGLKHGPNGDSPRRHGQLAPHFMISVTQWSPNRS